MIFCWFCQCHRMTGNSTKNWVMRKLQWHQSENYICDLSSMIMTMKSDPRLNWHFESSSRYSGLSCHVPSSSHRLTRSSRHELGLFVSSTSQIVSSPTSSSRRLPRSSCHDQTCRHRVRLIDSWDRLITHHSSSTRQVQSLSRRTLGSSRRGSVSSPDL